MTAELPKAWWRLMRHFPNTGAASIPVRKAQIVYQASFHSQFPVLECSKEQDLQFAKQI